MPSIVVDKDGNAREIDIFEMLPPDEGEISIYYGRIGSGKTTNGTRNILSDLRRGLVVYANWPLYWDGYDEREDKLLLALGLAGFKRWFYRIPRENYHFWNLAEGTIDGVPTGKEFSETLAGLTDCSIHLDEGHIPFDSYEATRMSETKRSAVFAMRHYDRRLTVYTQRANSVHVNLRGNANRFYKCEKTLDRTLFGKRFIRFLVTEFQDLTSSGGVDEELERDEDGDEIPGAYKRAVSQERFWGRQSTFAHFDTKYLRQGKPHSQPNHAEAYELTWREKWRRLKS